MDIPSSLLFQNERISNIYTFSPIGFIITLGFFVCILVFFRVYSSIKRNRVFGEKSIAPLPIPWIQDEKFEVKIAKFLRYIIAQIASQKHAYAHTSRDISHYMNDAVLIKTLSDVERVEYNGEILSTEKRGEILQIIETYRWKKLSSHS